jgi:cytochrome c-type biogenesis protein CcmE
MSERTTSDMSELDLSPRSQPPAGTGRGRRRWMPIVVLAVVLLAGGVMVAKFLTSAIDYYCNVDEIGVKDGCEAGRILRVQGRVEEGSVLAEGGVTNFVIAFNDVELPVRYDGDPGGLFQECIPVVVHGKLEGEVFLGNRLEVKHDESYAEANPDRIDDAAAPACEG